MSRENVGVYIITWLVTSWQWSDFDVTTGLLASFSSSLTGAFDTLYSSLSKDPEFRVILLF